MIKKKQQKQQQHTHTHKRSLAKSKLFGDVTPSSLMLTFGKVFLLNAKRRSEYAACCCCFSFSCFLLSCVFFLCFLILPHLLVSLQCLIFPLVASCFMYRLTIQCAVCNIHEISPDVACICESSVATMSEYQPCSFMK